MASPKQNSVPIHSLVGHRGAISALQVVGDLLLSGGADCTVRIWDWGSGQLRHCLQGHEKAICGLGLTSWQGRQILVSGCRSGEIRLWDPHTGEALGQMQTGLESIQALAVSSDGARLALASRSDAAIQVWDLSSRQPHLQLRGHADRIRFLALSQGGAFLVTLRTRYSATVSRPAEPIELHRA